jgi:hypothetical protein
MHACLTISQRARFRQGRLIAGGLAQRTPAEN